MQFTSPPMCGRSCSFPDPLTSFVSISTATCLIATTSLASPLFSNTGKTAATAMLASPLAVSDTSHRRSERERTVRSRVPAATATDSLMSSTARRVIVQTSSKCFPTSWYRRPCSKSARARHALSLFLQSLLPISPSSSRAMASRCASTVFLWSSTNAFQIAPIASCTLGFGSNCIRKSLGTSAGRCAVTCPLASLAIEANPNAAPRRVFTAAWWLARSMKR
mmetsp:Transcript_4662/g.6281  ORF Transcript_4662/g.6281 Transcript_4662/m.6281 type:complete len:222 (-) Transcript_4662:569-1234(-)